MTHVENVFALFLLEPLRAGARWHLAYANIVNVARGASDLNLLFGTIGGAASITAENVKSSE